MYYHLVNGRGITNKVWKIQKARQIWEIYPDVVFMNQVNPSGKKKLVGRQKFLRRFFSESEILQGINSSSPVYVLEEIVLEETMEEYERAKKRLHENFLQCTGYMRRVKRDGLYEEVEVKRNGFYEDIEVKQNNLYDEVGVKRDEEIEVKRDEEIEVKRDGLYEEVDISKNKVRKMEWENEAQKIETSSENEEYYSAEEIEHKENDEPKDVEMPDKDAEVNPLDFFEEKEELSPISEKNTNMKKSPTPQPVQVYVRKRKPLGSPTYKEK